MRTARSVRRSWGALAALGLGLALAFGPWGAGEARAQYGYGAFGWGGWGGGGDTPVGDVARGLGYYDVGAGVYNLDTAAAQSINANSVLRWNEYWYTAQKEANRRARERMDRRMRRDATSGTARIEAARENASDADIASGNALNVVLDQLSAPRVHGSSLRASDTKIPGKLVRALPFVHASEAVTISLNQLTGDESWPAALAGPNFAPERKAYRAAVQRSMDEVAEGEVKPQTMQEIRDTLARIRARLQANPPADRAQLAEAQNHVRTLAGMSRLLQRPDVEKAVAQLDQTRETSLGRLLAFMHAYNLRFGPANTPEQRAAYESLYPIMTAQRDRVAQALKEERKATAKADAPRYRPQDFLSPLELDDSDANRRRDDRSDARKDRDAGAGKAEESRKDR